MGPAVAPAGAATSYLPTEPVDVRLTLAALSRGRGDPTMQVDAGGIWRTSRTPDGSVTLRVEQASGGGVRARAWGPGSAWALAALPELLGERDRPGEFVPVHPLVAASHRRLRGLRFPRTGLVLEAVVPAVLEQKVTGMEARRAWRALLCRYGEPAPGPAPEGMRVFPPPEVWRRVPSWEWHRAGVDGRRAGTVLAAVAVAAALERTVELPGREEVERVLRGVPGIGAWTAAEVMQRAHGECDAVSVGDFHLAALVGWALLGHPVDDEGMLELLAPYAPHRGRATRLIELSGFRKPRFGPRYAPRDYRAI